MESPEPCATRQGLATFVIPAGEHKTSNDGGRRDPFVPTFSSVAFQPGIPQIFPGQAADFGRSQGKLPQAGGEITHDVVRLMAPVTHNPFSFHCQHLRKGNFGKRSVASCCSRNRASQGACL